MIHEDPIYQYMDAFKTNMIGKLGSPSEKIPESGRCVLVGLWHVEAEMSKKTYAHWSILKGTFKTFTCTLQYLIGFSGVWESEKQRESYESLHNISIWRYIDDPGIFALLGGFPFFDDVLEGNTKQHSGCTPPVIQCRNYHETVPCTQLQQDLAELLSSHPCHPGIRTQECQSCGWPRGLIPIEVPYGSNGSKILQWHGTILHESATTRYHKRIQEANTPQKYAKHVHRSWNILKLCAFHLISFPRSMVNSIGTVDVSFFLHLFAVGHLRSAWLWCSWWCECTWSHLVVRHACSCWKECRRKPAARDRTIEKKTEHMEWIIMEEMSHVSFCSPEFQDHSEHQRKESWFISSLAWAPWRPTMPTRSAPWVRIPGLPRPKRYCQRAARSGWYSEMLSAHCLHTLANKKHTNSYGEANGFQHRRKRVVTKGWYMIHIIKVQSRIYNTLIFWTIDPHCWFWTYCASSRAPP